MSHLQNREAVVMPVNTDWELPDVCDEDKNSEHWQVRRVLNKSKLRFPDCPENPAQLQGLYQDSKSCIDEEESSWQLLQPVDEGTAEGIDLDSTRVSYFLAQLRAWTSN